MSKAIPLYADNPSNALALLRVFQKLSINSITILSIDKH